MCGQINGCKAAGRVGVIFGYAGLYYVWAFDLFFYLQDELLICTGRCLSMLADPSIDKKSDIAKLPYR